MLDEAAIAGGVGAEPIVFAFHFGEHPGWNRQRTLGNACIAEVHVDAVCDVRRPWIHRPCRDRRSHADRIAQMLANKCNARASVDIADR